jgi:hypothetical protein
LKGEFGSVTAAVMTHRGVFSSLEFRPSPTKIKGHDFAVELVALPAGGRAEGLCPAAGGELVDETVRMRRLIEGSPFRRDRRHRQTAFVERLRFNSRNLLMYLAVPA